MSLGKTVTATGSVSFGPANVCDLGFDYQVKCTVPVYFGLLFYHLIEYAQANSVTRIFYSTVSGPTKRSRRCTLTGQYAYLKLINRRAQARLLEKVKHGESNHAG